MHFNNNGGRTRPKCRYTACSSAIDRRAFSRITTRIFCAPRRKSLSCVVNYENRRREGAGAVSARPSHALPICIILHHAAHILGAASRVACACFWRNRKGYFLVLLTVRIVGMEH